MTSNCVIIVVVVFGLTCESDLKLLEASLFFQAVVVVVVYRLENSLISIRMRGSKFKVFELKKKKHLERWVFVCV